MIPELKTNINSEAEVITEQSNFDINDMPIVYFGCFIVFVMILSFSVPFMIYLASKMVEGIKLKIEEFKKDGSELSINETEQAGGLKKIKRVWQFLDQQAD